MLVQEAQFVRTESLEFYLFNKDKGTCEQAYDQVPLIKTRGLPVFSANNCERAYLQRRILQCREEHGKFPTSLDRYPAVLGFETEDNRFGNTVPLQCQKHKES